MSKLEIYLRPLVLFENLIGHIQRELLEYYMGREFKGKIKETRVLVRQKKKKKVDN